MDDRSWLFPRGADRQRMLEMDRALRPVRQRAFAVLTVALLACGPWLGWWTTLPLVLAALIFRAVEPMAQRAERPEYAIFAAWAASELIIAISVALTEAPRVATTAWLALPLVTLGGRFSERGIAVGVASRRGAPARRRVRRRTRRPSLDNPPLVIAPLALMVAIGMFQTVLMRSDVKYRTQAILDPLTGVLNRMALAARVAELEQQSEITQHPIGVIAIDLDHFKAINDTHGHVTGDAVLKDRRRPAAHGPARVRPGLPHRRRGVRHPPAGSRPRRGRARRREHPARDRRRADRGRPRDREPRRQRVRARRALRLRACLRACGRRPLRRQAQRPQLRRAGRRRGAPGCRLTPVPTELRGPAGA